MLRRHWYLLCLLLALAGAAVTPLAAAEDPARAYPSLASPLADLYLETQRAPGRLAQAAAAHPDLRLAADGSVLVWVMQAPGALTDTVDTAALARLGGRIAGKSKHFLEAWIPIAVLPRVAEEVAGVTFLRPPVGWEQDSPVISQGVGVVGATAYHDAGLNGAGVKVAVIDISWGGFTAARDAGELPANIITQTFGGGGMDSGEKHGTACAEIVYDMVPGAQLYAIGIDPMLFSATENAIDYCVAQGISVVSWSLGTVTGNFLDGTGPLCDLMNGAFAQGLLVVASMGNYAANSVDAHFEGVTADGDNDQWIEFEGTDDMMAFHAVAGAPVQFWLNWDGWPATSIDYDLYIYDGPNSEIYHWITPQTGSQPPFEGGTFTPQVTEWCYLRVKRHSPSTPTGVKYEIYARDLDGGLEYSTSASSLGSPADATDVLAVGAINWNYWTAGPQEAYSSQGPTNDGRTKPDISGPDFVSTYSYGTGHVFIGTSAATPHVAGAAALIKSVHPTWTPTQVRDELLSHAIDMGASGDDNIYGYGRVALPPPQAHAVTVTASADPTSVGAGGTVQLSATAEDSSGHTDLTWEWSDNGAGGTFSPSASVQNPTWTAPASVPDSLGEYLLIVTVTCNQPPAAEGSTGVGIAVATHALTVSSTVTPAAVESGGSTSLLAQATDTSGHGIAYSWSDGGAGGSFSPGPNVPNPTYIAPANTSLTDLTVTLSITVTCDGAEPLSESDSPTLTVHPHTDFPDVPWDHWAFAQVEACYRAGIVGGYPNGTYRPTVEVTRDQMAVYIARALAGGDANVPTGPLTATFPDVPNTGYGDSGTDPYWAYQYIEYCAKNGIVQGFPDGNYKPEVVVTRDQMAVYVARSIATPTGDPGVPDPAPGTQTFTDVPPTIEADTGTVANWSYKYVEYCAGRGVVQGYQDGTYHPERAVTRDQMAVYVARGFGLLP